MSLPQDIWLHIASFIPPLQLEDLYSVNHILFNLAMDQRYQQISLSYLTRKTVRIMERIRDPVIAERVRILYLHPHFVKEVLQKDSSPSNSTILSRLGDFAYHIRDQRLFGRYRSRSPLFRFKTFDEFSLFMANTLSSLPNLVDLHVAWSGLPTIADSPVPIISSAFGPNLRRLWLELSLEKLGLMLPKFSCLPDLEELDLFLRIDHELDPKHYDNILIRFARIVNSLHRTLRKFAIQLWEPIDLSPFFSSLRRLRGLETISLSIPVGNPHLGDPDAVTDFLNLHSASLRSLTIRASELGEWGLTGTSHLSNWFQTTFTPVRLLRLTSLEISLKLIPLESAMICIHKFAGTLRSLVLTGRHLTFHDVETVTSAFPSCRRRLESVRLGSVTLNPQLFDMLAEKLPLLNKLELSVREVVPCEGDYPLYYKNGLDRHDQDESQLVSFYYRPPRRKSESIAHADEVL
ncbi:hypothetical protein E1B28_010098 [Marasmius oreades]|uniref:F-box domain-containing protein n=1 Tax=Marasmius oreades TaxID=181124 RepID=A0A9P7UR51_9AGAR|nr:uncharacterized protein E1B28_010098 [Marasmius oreades]KAG7091038.1 hypothetical protein E1B28_010098 [Marasmius oreades]